MRFERSHVGWLLCLNCAKVFGAARSETYCCPDCGFEFDLETLLHRTKLASDAVHFGYQYRLVYEEELGEEPRRHYSLLLLHEVVEWMVLAAISGLIGGASTELAKRAIVRIREQVAAEPELRKLDEAKIILDEEEFSKLLLYVTDFLNGMDNVPREVKSAIMEEMVTQRAVEVIARKREAGEALGSRSPVSEAAEELKKDNPLESADFAHMWKDIGPLS